MYQYGPGQPDPGQQPPPGGQYPPYQPSPDQQGGLGYPPPGPDQGGVPYPPPDPAGPPQSSPPFGSPPPAYDPAMGSGPPSSPVTGAGPMDQPPMGPPPGPPPPSGGKGPWIPLLAGGMALFLIASIVMTVLFFNTRSNLQEEQASNEKLEKNVSTLESERDELEEEIIVLEADLLDAELAGEEAEGLQTCLDSVKAFLDLVGDEDASDSEIEDAGVEADTLCYPYW